MTRRRMLGWLAGGLLLVPLGLFAAEWVSYPGDRTPQGAYLRIVAAVNRGRPEDFFAYLETAAQHACYTIRNYRKQALEQVLAAYPEPERSRMAEAYRPIATSPDGPEVFALYARERGWLGRLRRDMSRIQKVEIQGERATVETVRGTRYPMRRRDNGIWGLTLFTAELVAEAEKAARDLTLIERAAQQYQHAQRSERSPLP